MPAEVKFQEYLEFVRRYGTTSNGVYGLKIQWMHVATLANETGLAGDREGVLESLFPGAAFVNIVRRNRRAQALSWYRAIATNQWWHIRGDLRIRRRPALNMERVYKLEEEIVSQQSSWERYFRRRGIGVLTVEYERLAADYRTETERVLGFLGLKAEAAKWIPEPRLVRQADDLNERWLEAMQLDRPLSTT